MEPCQREFAVSLVALFDIPSSCKFSVRLPKPVVWTSPPELVDEDCRIIPLVDRSSKVKGLGSLLRARATMEAVTGFHMLVLL